MIAFNFLTVEPKGDISIGILTLLSMLLILVLAESFDNFSLGKLVSINRETKKQGEQIKGLEYKNSELLKQLITVSNTQTQTHTNVYGDYNEIPSTQRASDQKTDPKADKEEVEKLLAAVGDSIVIQEQVTKINADLESRGLSLEGDAVKVLVKHLAGTQLLLAFEQVHSLVFGSQIYLLKKLNESVGEGKALEFVWAHVDHVKSLYVTSSLAKWDYEQYLAFLYSQQLIVKGENQKIHITNLGVEYLTWIIRNGRREDNPL